MKHTIILLLPAFFFLAVHGLAAQDTTLAGILPVDAAGKIAYQEVVTVKDLTKDQLYNKGIAWLNENFPSPASVTSRRSPESGVFEGAYSIRLTDDHNGTQVPSKTIQYKFKLEFKDGRFRYLFTDFTLKTTSKFPLERWLDKNGPYYDIGNRPYLVQIKTEMERLTSGLVEFMTRPEPPAEDDW